MNLFFKDKAFDYETLRALSYYNYQGAEIGEIIQIVNKIKSGNFESWYKSWKEMADRLTKIAANTKGISAGETYLRASNYYRNAEFFLYMNEERRIQCYQESERAFRKGLDLLNRQYDILEVPCVDYVLKGYLFQHDINAPTFIFIGGYDSTVEELYFAGGEAAYKRGYNVVIFDGPGQGAVLRYQDIKAQYDFEKPVEAMLDYLEKEKSLKISTGFVGLMGMSLGGYYAARVAACEKRIDACILFDTFTDVWEAITEKKPILKNLQKGEHLSKFMLKYIIPYMDANTRWLIQNAFWVYGTTSIPDLISTVKSFTIRDVAVNIECPMLLLAGTNDHFAALNQIEYLKQTLNSPYDVYIFDDTFGAQEHCQEGNLSFAHMVIFDWLDAYAFNFRRK